jgi:hypothetical protein
MDNTRANYRRLDPEKIVETVQTLQHRVDDRFPASGLGRVVTELRKVAEETIQRTGWIQKPHLPLRASAVLLSAVIVALLTGMLLNIRHFQFEEYTNFIQALEASISSVVFIGAAIVFLVNWENRIKRRRALQAIHELRALAHIVDMHQLTKDPENSFKPEPVPPTKKRGLTPFEFARYLDYCGDALALISKIAALYVQDYPDTVILDAVDDVEDLTAGFSRKIWQKITILENLGRNLSPPEIR